MNNRDTFSVDELLACGDKTGNKIVESKKKKAKSRKMHYKYGLCKEIYIKQSLENLSEIKKSAEEQFQVSKNIETRNMVASLIRNGNIVCYCSKIMDAIKSNRVDYNTVFVLGTKTYATEFIVKYSKRYSTSSILERVNIYDELMEFVRIHMADIKSKNNLIYDITDRSKDFTDKVCIIKPIDGYTIDAVKNSLRVQNIPYKESEDELWRLETTNIQDGD